jgi:hypothetical protein
LLAPDARVELLQTVREVLPRTVVLRPTLLLDNFSGPLRPALEGGVIPQGIPADVRVAYISAEDQAAHAVAALDRPELAGELLPIAGADAVTGPELAQVLGAALGAPLTYLPMSEAQTREALAFAGEDVAAAVAQMYLWEGTDGADQLAPDLSRTREALGVTPTPLADWARAQPAPSPGGRLSAAEARLSRGRRGSTRPASRCAASLPGRTSAAGPRTPRSARTARGPARAGSSGPCPSAGGRPARRAARRSPYHRHDGGVVRHPGEVQRGGVPTGARAEPEGSAAIVRSSPICSTAAIDSRRSASRSSAGTASSRRTNHSDCSSSPLLGRVLEPEVGQPRVPGPGHAELLGAGVAGHARHRVARAVRQLGAEPGVRASSADGASVRSLRQAVCCCGLRQSLNRLTLYPADTSASYCSRTISCGSPSYTYCRTS